MTDYLLSPEGGRVYIENLDVTHCRSKNAGPYLLTVDLVLADRVSYEFAEAALTAAAVASSYGVPPSEVLIVKWASELCIKVTLPRWCVSGAPGDRDVFGCQQHVQLLRMPVPAKR